MTELQAIGKTLLDYLQNGGIFSAKVGIALLLIALSWHLFNKLLPTNVTEELFHRRNRAFLVWRLSFVVGQAIALMPTMSKPEGPLLVDLGWMAFDGLLVSTMLLLMTPVVNRIVLRDVDDVKAALEGNMAVALANAGFFVGAGIILNGCLDGSAPSVGIGIAASVVFGLLGLAVVVGVYWLHELVTSYSLRACIREGRMTAAFELAGLLVATALVVREGVAGEFTNWSAAYAGFVATVVIGVVSLYVVRLLVDMVLLPGPKLTLKAIEKNDMVEASAFLAMVLVAVALLLAQAIRVIL